MYFFKLLLNKFINSRNITLLTLKFFKGWRKGRKGGDGAHIALELQTKNNRCRLLSMPKLPKDSIECMENDKKWHLFRKFRTFSAITQAVILAQILLPLAYSIMNISLLSTTKSQILPALLYHNVPIVSNVLSYRERSNAYGPISLDRICMISHDRMFGCFTWSK